MDIYMQIYKSGDVDKEILQTATNLADRATMTNLGFGKNTMPLQKN